MILYRKGASLRVRRAAAPAAPFWCATTIAPYAAKRAAPIAIDYLTLLETQRSLYQAQDDQISINQGQLQSFVQLRKALGS